MRLVDIFYCSPTPATWRQGSFNPFAILHVPIYWSPPPRRIAGGGGDGPITRSHFLLARGEGGDRYNTTTCGMSKGTKDPCISHDDASHADGQGQNHPLLFCNFFYIVKIIEKSLFYEPEIGFIGRKPSKRRIRYFF